MKNEQLEKSILQMESIITTLDHAIASGEYTDKEAKACELLRDARLKLIEELEEQPLYKIEISVGYAFFTWYSGESDYHFKQGLYKCLYDKDDVKEVKMYESGTLTKHLKIIEVVTG